MKSRILLNACVYRKIVGSFAIQRWLSIFDMSQSNSHSLYERSESTRALKIDLIKRIACRVKFNTYGQDMQHWNCVWVCVCFCRMGPIIIHKLKSLVTSVFAGCKANVNLIKTLKHLKSNTWNVDRTLRWNENAFDLNRDAHIDEEWVCVWEK